MLIALLLAFAPLGEPTLNHPRAPGVSYEQCVERCREVIDEELERCRGVLTGGNTYCDDLVRIVTEPGGARGWCGEVCHD